MADIRKIIIIFVVAILFAVLVFSVIEAVYPGPNYEDYCGLDRHAEPMKLVQDTSQCEDVNVSTEEQKACADEKGYIRYNYDSKGCPTSYVCDTCQTEWNSANEKYNQVSFYVSAILALIAIFVGLYLPAEQNTLNEWIGTGFMLGGAFALFFGTARSFSDLGRYIRAIIIFLELVLVIFIAYRKVGNLRKDKKAN